MDERLNSVDSLLEQAGLLPNALNAADSAQQKAENLTGGFPFARAGSVTDLDADLLGVKLDDCSRYFKKEIMVSFCPQLLSVAGITVLPNGSPESMNLTSRELLQGFFLHSKAKLTFEGRALAEAEQQKGADQLAESQARLEAVKQELHLERQLIARSDTLLNR